MSADVLGFTCASRRARFAIGLFASLALACASAPVTYTEEEFEAKKAEWKALFEQGESLCQTATELSCAEMSVFIIDHVLDDGKGALPLDSYQQLWAIEQDIRKQYGIEGEVHKIAPVPETPSELAEARAQQRAAYEGQQRSVVAFVDLLAQLLAARGPSAGAATGIPVYNASQCTGPIIMGQCHGSTIGPPQKTCHGAMLNGQCTGPMF